MEKGPRAILFATLAILWIFPSAGAIWILFRGNKAWLQIQTIGAVPLEEWIAAVILLAHLVFMVFAWRLRGFQALRH